MYHSDIDKNESFDLPSDPWGTALGKAYTCLCSAADAVLTLLDEDDQSLSEAYVTLFDAMQEAEEYLVNSCHPLETYLP